MKLERAKNTKRNIIWGIAGKLLATLLPFIGRTIFIYVLGKEYLGLNNLFVSVLQVLSLAELGVGSAMVYGMYKPVAENDTAAICAFMNFYKICYRYIGLVILVIGLILFPFTPKLVSGSYPDEMNLYVIYAINLSGTVISYFLFAYKNCLLNVFQRVDIASGIGIVISVVKTILQIILLLLTRNYYMYLIVVPVMSAVCNIITSIIVSKRFPEYKAEGKLGKEQYDMVKAKIKGLVFYRLGYIVNNSVDNIVISMFLGVGILGVYSNYLYIITTVYGFIQILYDSVRAAIGNYIASETLESNYRFFQKINFLQHWLIVWCSVCFLCLYQPFIEIWIGKDMLLPMPVVICLVIYFITLRIQDIVNLYKEGAGMWDQDKFRPLIVAAVNLTLNLIIVRYIGLYGIILSTVFAIWTVSMPWCSRVLYKHYFNVPVRRFYKTCLSTIVAIMIAGGATYYLCSLITSVNILTLAIKALICVTVPNLICLLLFCKNEQFLPSIRLFLNMVGIKPQGGKK